MGNEPSTGKSTTGDTENPSPPIPEVKPSEATTLLGKVKSTITGLTQQQNAATKTSNSDSSWIKMPIQGAKSALNEATTAIDQSQNNPCPCLDLTYSQRFLAFAVCFAVGSFLSIISTMNVPSIVLNPKKFAVPFTLGNIVSLLSMSFLIGFKKQCSSIFHKDRVLTSTVFIISMIGTMFSSFFLHSSLLTFCCVIIQYSAYIWYCASYIPYGRATLYSCGKKLIQCCI